MFQHDPFKPISDQINWKLFHKTNIQKRFIDMESNCCQTQTTLVMIIQMFQMYTTHEIE